MHREVVRGSVVVEVCEVMDGAHCGDCLANCVDDGQRHDRPVLKGLRESKLSAQEQSCSKPKGPGPKTAEPSPEYIVSQS